MAAGSSVLKIQGSSWLSKQLCSSPRCCCLVSPLYLLVQLRLPFTFSTFSCTIFTLFPAPVDKEDTCARLEISTDLEPGLLVLLMCPALSDPEVPSRRRKEMDGGKMGVSSGGSHLISATSPRSHLFRPSLTFVL